MNSIAQILKSLGPARVATMAVVAAGLLGLFLLMSTRFSAQPMTLLFGELALEDSGRIVARLDALHIPYELRGDGAQIMVPRDQVARLRMTLAGEGLPNGGSVGYELFDQSANFGTTSFVQHLNQMRALEGELARTISSIKQVQAARVHLVLPTRELFAKEKEQPSASIVLKLRSLGLDQGQVLAIQHLVAAAVPGLTTGRISIVDDRGTLLARSGGGAEGGNADIARTIDELDRRFEDRLGRSVEALLERTLGPGKVRAEVAADLDFDRVTLQQERFDPDGQVVRSTAVEEQNQQAQENKADDRVTVANNLPPNGAGNAAGAALSNNRSTNTRETTNYEISKTLETHVREGGKINRISIAVLVDGTVGPDGVYKPRSDEELQSIAQLVRSSVGFKQERGDVVQVVNMQFAAPEAVETPVEPLSLFGLGKDDLMRFVELGILGIVSILVLLLIVRPVVTRLVEALPAAAPKSAPAADNLLASNPQLSLPAAPPPDDGEALAAAKKSQIDQMMNVAKVEGQVRASSVKQITEIVEQHPDETVAILRNWMVQGR